MESVTINRSLAIATFACLRLLERSLDASIHDSWGKIAGFFSRSRVRQISIVIKELSVYSQHNSGMAQEFHATRLGVVSRAVSRSVFCALGRIRLSREEVCVIHSLMIQCLELVGQSERPSDAELVKRRMQLAACEVTISQRMTKRSLQAAQNVEHFNSSDFCSRKPLIDFIRW